VIENPRITRKWWTAPPTNSAPNYRDCSAYDGLA
jgi:hypothetical protein